MVAWALLAWLALGAWADLPHRRFEYKYSFKPPYLAQKDGSVPFWEYTGNAIASEESVRITPSLRSQKGSIWTKMKTAFEWWEVEIVFRVTGRGRIGADGLAFWFTEEKGVEGPVFGSSDMWRGLGIFFDSFDNDNKHNNPYIMAMVNDGTKVYDHQNDGSTQQIAGCLRDFRNKPFPVRAKVEYYRNTLTVMIHNGMTNGETDFEMCVRAENVFMPQSGYFGLSAATGGLADDHDVLKFNTFSLHPPDTLHPDARLTEEEQKKLSHEFQEYQKKLDQQKEDYRRDNPDAKLTSSEVPDDWFETDQQRELRQIFMGQSQIFEVIRDLNRKLDEVIGRQERTLSMITAVQSTGGAPAPSGQAHTGGQVPMAQIQRHEVDSILSSQREIASAAHDIRAFVTEINQKSNSIIQNQAKAPTATVQNVGYDVHAVVNEVKEGLNIVKRDIGVAAQRLAAQPTCPPQQGGGCVTTSIFVVVMAVQLFLACGYMYYK